MLIYLLGLKQFGQRVGESLPNLVLDSLRDPLKQTKAHKLILRQPQNGAKLSPKPTPRNKRNITKEKHMKGGHLQR
jgi:hypothetical protein